MRSVIERLSAFIPVDTDEKADLRLQSKMVVNGSFGIGLYWAWLYTVCFSTTLFLPDHAVPSIEVLAQTTSYFGYIAVLVVTLLISSFRMSKRRSQVITIVASIITAGGTLVVAASNAFPTESAAVLVTIGSLLSGAGSGVFLSAWGFFFAHIRALAPVQLMLGLLISAVFGKIILVLPFGPAVVCMVILPLAFGFFCHRASTAAIQNHHVDLEAKRAKTRITRIFPWRPCFALTMTGIIFAMALCLGFEYLVVGLELGESCLLVNAALGVVVLIYTRITRQNFGFSMAYMAVLPLTVFGTAAFAFFGQPAVFVFFFAVRASYVLFDVMTWLQVSKIYETTGEIRTFIVSRLALEGGFGAGMACFRIFLSGQILLFDLALLAAVTLFCIACLLAFMNNNVENAWGLLPRPHESTHSLRSASNDIAKRFKLTKRETEVMMLILRGKNGPYIQDKLCISQNTYQTHTRNLYRKLDIHSRQELFDLLDECFAERKDQSER